MLVSGTIYDEFVERMHKRADQLQVGYQLLPTTHQGPLVSAGQLATVWLAGCVVMVGGTEMVSVATALVTEPQLLFTTTV